MKPGGRRRSDLARYPPRQAAQSSPTLTRQERLQLRRLDPDRVGDPDVPQLPARAEPVDGGVETPRRAATARTASRLPFPSSTTRSASREPEAVRPPGDITGTNGLGIPANGWDGWTGAGATPGRNPPGCEALGTAGLPSDRPPEPKATGSNPVSRAMPCCTPGIGEIPSLEAQGGYKVSVVWLCGSRRGGARRNAAQKPLGNLAPMSGAATDVISEARLTPRSRGRGPGRRCSRPAAPPATASTFRPGGARASP